MCPCPGTADRPRDLEPLQHPIYFYRTAASRPDRALLGGRCGRDNSAGACVSWSPADAAQRPDLGGPELHPTAGASAVGARSLSLTTCTWTGRTSLRLGHRQALRASNGGLEAVKAMGVLVRGRARISLNITDFRLTPVGHAFAAVSRLAATHGTKVVDAELIGPYFRKRPLSVIVSGCV